MWNVKSVVHAVAAVLLVLVANSLAIRDSNASFVNPVVGFCIALLVHFGWRSLIAPLVGMWLAQFLLFQWSNLQFEAPPFVLASGLTLNLIVLVLLVGWLINTVYGKDILSDIDSKYLKLIVLCAVFPALLSSMASCLMLAWASPLQYQIGFDWFVRFLGDLLGIVIFFPIFQLFISESSRENHLKWLAVGIPVVLVLLTFVAGLKYVESNDREQFALQFNQKTALYFDSIKRSFDSNLDSVYSTRGLFECSNHVDRNEFSLFANSLLVRHTGIKAIEWIPRIPIEQEQEFIQSAIVDAASAYDPKFAESLKRFKFRSWNATSNSWDSSTEKSSRDRYPVFYMEPFYGNESAFGIDLATHPDRKKALDRAYHSDMLESTTPIRLVQDDAGKHGFLVFLRVSRKLTDSDAKGNLYNNGQESTLGFVAGVYLFEDILGSVVGDHLNEHCNLTVTDISDSDSILLTRIGETQESIASEFRHEYNYSFANRKWRFVFEPNSEAQLAINGWRSWLTVSVGSALATLLLFTLLVVTARTDTVEKMVFNRTAQLKNEIVERQRIQVELERKAFALEKSNLELDRFAYVASHDLKAPLRAIDQLSQWIAEDVSDVAAKDTHRHLELMQNRVRRLERLLDDLLDYARVDTGASKRVEVDVNMVIDEIRFLLGPPRGFQINIPAVLPIVNAEKAALEVCFRNLISNAIKHHDTRAGSIDIGFEDQGDMIAFMVTDDGPGIDVEYHQQVFDMFRTLKPRDDVEGSGMGLALVKKIVTAVGGRIWIDPSYLDGTRAVFLWPKGLKTESKVDHKVFQMS